MSGNLNLFPMDDFAQINNQSQISISSEDNNETEIKTSLKDIESNHSLTTNSSVTNVATIISNPISSSTQEKPKKQMESISSDSLPKNENGTINEPILQTIKRDFFRIGKKLYYVLNPFGNSQDRPKQLLQWDLWGPLIFNLMLAITLSFNNSNKEDIFVLVFLLYWVGSFLVYLNGNLLGSKLGMFHIMCLIGYCMFPLNISAIVFACVNLHNLLRLIMIIFSCIWASYSSIGFLKTSVQEDKRILLLYPIILEYLFISGVILLNKSD